jgi:hypothetical protein
MKMQQGYVKYVLIHVIFAQWLESHGFDINSERCLRLFPSWYEEAREALERILTETILTEYEGVKLAEGQRAMIADLISQLPYIEVEPPG